jgi:prepilin-type N-terminal cleavage/methylation domain-containing protein
MKISVPSTLKLTCDSLKNARAVPWGRAGGFSLLEMLVAMAVLSLMMLFMFQFVGQSFRAWDSGMRQIEAAQAARTALDRMARDLKFSVAGNRTITTAGGAAIPQIIPFYENSNPSTVPGEADFLAPPGSAQIFTVAPVMHPLTRHGPFTENGYFTVYNTNARATNLISGKTYSLMWHAPYGQDEPKHDIYYRGQATTNWFGNADNSSGTVGNRIGIIDNCYKMETVYAVNTPAGLQFTNSWTATDRLPAGVLITLFVMDAKTAQKIASLRPEGMKPDSAESQDVLRIRDAGTVTVSRFIPFINSSN